MTVYAKGAALPKGTTIIITYDDKSNEIDLSGNAQLISMSKEELEKTRKCLYKLVDSIVSIY